MYPIKTYGVNEMTLMTWLSLGFICLYVWACWND